LGKRKGEEKKKRDFEGKKSACTSCRDKQSELGENTWTYRREEGGKRRLHPSCWPEGKSLNSCWFDRDISCRGKKEVRLEQLPEKGGGGRKKEMRLLS